MFGWSATRLGAPGSTASGQISGQTTVNFTFNNNPSGRPAAPNHFDVILKLGKFYDLDTGAGVQPCNITLLAVVTPLNNGATTAYAVPQSDFAVIQNRNSGINSVATALASAPVSEVAF